MLKSLNLFFVAGMFVLIGCGRASDSVAPFSSASANASADEVAKKATVARLTALQASLVGLQARVESTYKTASTTFIQSYEIGFFDVGILLETTCVLDSSQGYDRASVKTQMTLTPQGDGSFSIQDKSYAPDRTVSVIFDGRKIERVCGIPSDLMLNEVRIADLGMRVSIQGKDSVLVFSKLLAKDTKSN